MDVIRIADNAYCCISKLWFPLKIIAFTTTTAIMVIAMIEMTATTPPMIAPVSTAATVSLD